MRRVIKSMTWFRLFSVSSLAFVLPCAAVAQESNVRTTDKLQGELVRIIEEVGSTDLIPVTIVMKDQVDREFISEVSRVTDKAFRREVVTDRLKEISEQSQGDLLARLSAGQDAGEVGDFIRSLWIHSVIGAEVTPQLAMEIAARDDVAYVRQHVLIGEDVFPVEPESDPAGPTAGIECGVDVMRAPEVWNDLGITGKGVVVGVIDTGCCITHPDLVNQIWTNPGEIPENGVDDDDNGYIDDVYGWNFESNNNDIGDSYSHGTHVSGTVGGDGTNGETTGMAPDVAIMSLKFWNSFSGEQTVWDSIQYGVDNGADALTASLGWPHSMNPDRYTWRIVCENAMAAGVVVVFAAGNEGCSNPPDNVRTPGDVPDMITIGATDCHDSIAYFSSCGPITWEDIAPWYDWPYPPGKIKPTVSAPGYDTLSTSYDCWNYMYMSGTSMATPHVTGAIALMLEANPDLDHFAVKDILMNTAVDLGSPGMDNTYGAGRVDAYEAVLAAMTYGYDLHLDGPDVPTAGEINDFVCTGAGSGNTVALLYAFSTGETNWPACPGVSIHLNGPMIGQVQSADGSGTAVFSVYVPYAASGMTTYQQSAEPATCATSNVVEVYWP